MDELESCVFAIRAFLFKHYALLAAIVYDKIRLRRIHIDEVIIEDWADADNIIKIITEGDGVYEFSLDGLCYQDSPQFYNRSGVIQYT